MTETKRASVGSKTSFYNVMMAAVAGEQIAPESTVEAPLKSQSESYQSEDEEPRFPMS